MTTAVTVIIGIILVLAILLVLVVLAQNAKGGGLSSQFTGASSSQLMGVKRTSDLLEKLTWGISIAIMVLTLSTGFILNGARPEEGGGSANVERALETPAAAMPEAPLGLPEAPADGGAADDPFAAPEEAAPEE